MSPPLLQPVPSHAGSPLSPITESREITEPTRLRLVSKTCISPMLSDCRTNPLPAHSPWSDGSMSRPGPPAAMLALALSTALRPLTPTAPPVVLLATAQPVPDWHDTPGGVTPGPPCFLRLRKGITWGVSGPP